MFKDDERADTAAGQIVEAKDDLADDAGVFLFVIEEMAEFGAATNLLQNAAQLRLEEDDKRHSAVADDQVHDPGQGSQPKHVGQQKGKQKNDETFDDFAGAGAANKHQELIDQKRNDDYIKNVSQRRTIKNVPKKVLHLRINAGSRTTSLSADYFYYNR